MNELFSGDWPATSALLDIALDLAPDQRESWLEGLSGEDAKHVPALRDFMARNASLEENQFLARLPEFASLHSDLPEDGQPAPGASIGPYTLIKLLGRGGMSTVFLASRGGHIKREVALKVPHSHLLVAQMAERFDRERDILAALAHPNIARLYDAGISAEGQPYLAMEYVDGTPLIEYCNNARLGIDQRLLLFQQVLAAVRHAHSKLVLHRDLKPSNILVTAESRVLLLDFGIAKLIADDAAGDSEATRFGGRALTPAYASPEQISGESLSTASDVYSLGVILYELLTGGRPYRPQRKTAAAVEEAILNTDAPHLTESVESGQAERLGTTAPKLDKALRGDLDAIVRKALRRSPAARYASAEEFSRDLAACAAGEPVSAHPDSRTYLMRKFVGRHKGAFAAAAAIFLAVAAGGAASLISARAAIAQRDRALALASRNEAISVFLKYLIADAAESDKPVTISDMLKRSEALIESETRGNAEHQAAVLDMLGNEYRTTGEVLRAEALTGRAVDLARGSRDPVLKAMVSCDHAGALDNAGKKAEAQAILRGALREKIDDARVDAGCIEELADSADDAGNFEESLDLSLSALKRLRQARDVSPSLEAEYIGSVALLMSKNGRTLESERYFRDATERLQVIGRGNSSTALVLLNDYGVSLLLDGNPKRAIGVLQQVLSGLVARDPNAQPWVPTLYNLGRSQDQAGHFPDAIATHQKCVEVATSVGQKQLATLCLLNRAIDELDAQQPSMAERHVNEAIDMGRNAAAPDSATESMTHLALGRIAAARRQFDRARSEYAAPVSLWSGVASFKETALLDRAQANLEDDKPEDALRDAQEALDLARKLQGDALHSNRTGLAWEMIARIRHARGDNAGAGDAARSAVAQFSDTVDADLPQFQAAAAIEKQSKGVTGGL